MPTTHVVIEGIPSTSVRARQLSGMFDVPPAEKQKLEWQVSIPIEDKPWNIGLIVGPSGCGKSTIARKLFPDAIDRPLVWNGASVIDDFAESVSVTAIADACQSVGFNTIPAWLRPFHVLSNGEQFRVSMARRILEGGDLVVVDEFTSVVDRQVAQIVSHSVQKAVRKRGSKFIAVSCHSDIVEWLQPDWIFEPATCRFVWRSLQRRPQLEGDIRRVDYSLWRLFAPYHYMSANLHRSAQCFALFIDGNPVAFNGWLHRPHPRLTNLKSLSRSVVLPDFQGIGLAFILTETIASAYKALGFQCRNYPAHPSFIRSYARNPRWVMTKEPGKIQNSIRISRALYLAAPNKAFETTSFGDRPCATFAYIGPAMEVSIAQRLLAR